MKKPVNNFERKKGVNDILYLNEQFECWEDFKVHYAYLYNSITVLYNMVVQSSVKY